MRMGLLPQRAAAAVVACLVSALLPGCERPPSAPAAPASPASAASGATPAPLPASGGQSRSGGSVAQGAGTEAAGAAALLVPVQGFRPDQLQDTFTQARSEGRQHEAIDILAPKGTPVVAVADGRVAKLFDSRPGGLTVYQFDSSERLAYYYAHLDRYADGLQEGQWLRRGQLLGYVGSTGNASPEAPHLHFAVFELGPEKRWWEGRPINPYPLFQPTVPTAR